MTATPAPDSLGRLLEIMARLRRPVGGCPWDLAQDFASIAPYTVEEAHEVAATIRSGPDPDALRDELGDLLFQVVYHARLAEERGWFDFAAVATTIGEKMVRRHPHVFGAATPRDPTAQAAAWEAGKATERAAAGMTGVLADVPETLPALIRADKLARRAARVGFDWPDAGAVLDKLAEETAELQAELRPAAGAPVPHRLVDEVGDMLFVLANLARKLGFTAEHALTEANAKFTRRFHAMEATLAAAGRLPAETPLAELEAVWRLVKAAEREAVAGISPDGAAPATG